MVDKIITETINKYVNGKMYLKEYKNPNDSDTIRVCADQLEGIYQRILSNGGSRNEYSVMQLVKVINELRKIEKWFR